MRPEDKPAIRYGDCVVSGEAAIPDTSYCNCDGCVAFYGYREFLRATDSILDTTVAYLRARGYSLEQVIEMLKRVG